MNPLTPAEKIKLALDWVARLEPIAVPVVLTRWSVRADATCPTMSTNGRTLNYNPDFVEKLSVPATKSIVLHEVGHVLSNHQHRRGTRNPKGYNIAADLALNCMLTRGYHAAFENNYDRFERELIHSEISGGCFVGFKDFVGLPFNKSAEEYYDLLKARAQPPPPQPPSNPKPCRDRGQGQSPLGDLVTPDPDYDPGQFGADETEDDGEGRQSTPRSGPSFDESDFDESEGQGTGDPTETPLAEGDDSDSAPQGQGKDLENDPFADLPDPSETFGGGIEDAPIESLLREDEAKLILEVLLGGDSYSPTGLGSILSEFKQKVEGDPELAASINWRRELEKFLRTQHAAGWKYDRPSRRHSHRRDLVLPARRARSKTRGLVIVDTSGSMGDSECNQALTHLGKILSLFPASTATLVQCDTGVRVSREYRASDFPIKEFEGWAGRGGTEMDPAFRWAKERRSQYDWVIMVSDMEWSWYRATDPGIPVLWINTRPHLPWGWSERGRKMPFGKLINFHAIYGALD